MTLRKPFSEVLQWPEDELSLWAASFSIDDNGDKPRIKRPPPTEEEEIQQMKQVLS